MAMILVVGLGNPGSEYARNRHNVGFMAADELVRRHSFSPWRSRFQGEMSEGVIDGDKVLVLKPMTFMNLSGQSVAAAARFLKIPVTDVVVLHDELDVLPGRVKVKRGGGSGGHNGLKSIDQHLGQDYRRVRIGIGHPGDKAQVASYVLHDFAKADSWVQPVCDALAQHMPQLLAGDEAGFMNRVTVATQPPKPKKDKPADRPATTKVAAVQPVSADIGNALAQAFRAALDKAKD